MQAFAHTQVRKRPVNLTLNEYLVLQVRQLTPNLSGVVGEIFKVPSIYVLGPLQIQIKADRITL